MASKHYVYVIGREEGPIKVGISSNPHLRLSNFQIACPFQIELLHVQEMRNHAHARWHEHNFHEVWPERRLVGEWFSIDAELAIESIETALEIEAHCEQERGLA